VTNHFSRGGTGLLAQGKAGIVSNLSQVTANGSKVDQHGFHFLSGGFFAVKALCALPTEPTEVLP
jgi:hypothetical protein